jgi:alpha-aminoadipic semialdehyde synthase
MTISLTTPRHSLLSRVFISSRLLSTSTRPKVTIGIRREDPERIWERRCPLTPEAVDTLVRKEGVRVLVQDCDRRVFGVGEFVKVCCLFSLHGGCCCFWLTRPTFIQAGAEIHPTLSPAHIIMGIKETPLHELVTSPVSSPSPSRTTAMIPRTHLMFSHTTKGQPYNMELLSRFLKRMEGDRNEDVQREGMQPRLIDYELIVGEDGKRCVGFGWFAGGSFLVLTSYFFPSFPSSLPYFRAHL